MGERVVVTGMGAVTPLGQDIESSWQAALAEKAALAPLRFSIRPA